MTTQVNLFAAPAAALASTTVAFISANKASDNASTPFARSALATVIGGVASLAMIETVVIASMGSPKGSNGKPVAKVSGLRDLDGGARLYQAWKAIGDIVANVDTDQAVTVTGPDGEVTVGTGAIRTAVEGFVLEADGAPRALFGKTGLVGTVKAAMTAHAKAVATAMGVASEDDTDTDTASGDNDNAAPVTLADRAAAMLVALRAASDADFTDAQAALAMLSDYIDTRWNEIADATAPAVDAAVNG